MLTAALAFPLNALGDNGCQYIGSWFGYDADENVSWISQAVGPNNSSGTLLLELPGFDMTFGGLFEAADASDLKGVWERTGGNTFRYATMSFATNLDGAAVYAARLTGDLEVIGECDVLHVTNTWLTIYILAPESDPVPVWDREPDVGPLPFAPHKGYRIKP
jgi:hypothetical protein